MSKSRSGSNSQAQSSIGSGSSESTAGSASSNSPSSSSETSSSRRDSGVSTRSPSIASARSVLVPTKRPRPRVRPPSPPADIYEELETVFNWNPQNLDIAEKRVDNSPGRGTRDLCFYAKHIAPHLTLKRVVHVRDLHKKMAHALDEKMAALREQGVSLTSPDSEEGVYTRKGRREYSIRAGRYEMRNEIDVAQFYYRSTACYCLPIASTLAFHPDIWSSILRWSDEPHDGCYPIVDGTFEVMPLRDGLTRKGPDGEPEATIWDYVDDVNFKHLREIGRRYPRLATWQIMKVSVGVDAVLPRLMSMVHKGTFRWRRCRGDPCLPPKQTSESKFVLSKDSPEIVSLITSPLDSSPQPLPPLSDNPSSTPDESSTRNSTEILDDAFRRGGSSFDKFKELDDAHQMYIRNALEASQNRAAARERGPAESESGTLALTEDKLLMKTWTQSIRDNSTLIILHTGNLEFICVRHRESQTLYISDILHLPCMKDPMYGRTVLGVYLTALDDAIRRNTLDSAADKENVRPSTPPAVSTSDDGHESDGSAKKKARRNPPRRARPVGGSRNVKSATSGKSPEKPPPSEEWLIAQVTSPSRSVLLMHLQYDIYHTVNPGIFRRGARINTAPGLTSPSTTPPLTRFPTNERLILVLTSELGGGAVGIVHGGILTVESSRKKSSSLKVAAKLSFTPRQQKALLHEISVYKHMAAQGVEGVPIILGDWHDSEEDGPSCLLMTYAGLSLRDRRAKITPDQRHLPRRFARREPHG
ncbi:hypothetical protein PLICRDRAFT_451808 [Plicaturopsis crispa FD-325 SS-3]|uniref:Protein kinase domain-containing protein n=1 Tax=Plicaturopsis crispa FD-325 SS-3 TaxID=944288 RepID=A0A0C9T5K6_PLICR|nr:hypothetical protein PLICRDRAFT_451808 [Plicaturopsis crispa FD-325 SS-3]